MSKKVAIGLKIWYTIRRKYTERVISIKHIFIINPTAGKGNASKLLMSVIEDACTAAGVHFEIYTTRSRGDATEYVRRMIADKPEGITYRFYACGGDGTLSEVVAGAVNTDAINTGGPIPGVEVGCIPVGTGNDFVRNFTNSAFFSDVTKQILADPTVIDCYNCGGIYGVNMINIGFDCEVAIRASENKKKKFMPKSLAYIAGVFTEFKKNEGRRMCVTLDDGRVIDREFQLVSVANGGFCGGGFHSAPRSVLSDGLLDISLIDKVTRTTFLKLVGPYKKGTHLGTKTGKRVVHYIQGKRVAIDFGEPANVCIDGEIVKMESLEMSVVPSSLAFAIPVGCEIDHFDA